MDSHSPTRSRTGSMGMTEREGGGGGLTGGMPVLLVINNIFFINVSNSKFLDTISFS